MITRAVFGVLSPPVLAIAGVPAALVLTLVLYATHPALALLPVVALAFGIYLFARWDQRRPRPPDA